MKLAVHKASSVEPRPLEWLWHGRIVKAKVNVLAGNPGVGKGLITCDLTAVLTTGRKFADCENENEPMGVAMLACEDGEADTIRPRLEAAGADLDRVYLIDSNVKPTDKAKARFFALDQDIADLRALLQENPSIKLVVIDPVSSYLGAAQMNKEQEVRRVLGPLAQLAEETGVTFLLVMHFNKRADVSALHRIMGAVGLTGVARAVWICAPDPDSEYNLFLPEKMNIAKKAQGLKYAIEERSLSYGSAPFITWHGTTSTTADQALSAKAKTSKLAVTKEWLSGLLASDTPATEVYEAAERAGISEKTLMRAKNSLKVVSDRRTDDLGEPHWVWLALAQPETFGENFGNPSSNN